jgi:nucleoside permease NupC
MIIFFSSLIAVLYHLKVMAIVIKLLGGGLKKLLGTSRTESLSAAANIFVGQTEAPLVVKPYISRMKGTWVLRRGMRSPPTSWMPPPSALPRVSRLR